MRWKGEQAESRSKVGRQKVATSPVALSHSLRAAFHCVALANVTWRSKCDSDNDSDSDDDNYASSSTVDATITLL